MMGTNDAPFLAPSESADASPLWWACVLRLKRVFGVDRAVAYTVLARIIQILGSAGTVLLILRFLTPVEQGYYYTLLSLVSLQTVFELGFSFVILQMAAHESVQLTIHPDGRIEGDPLAHARLASTLQLTVRWYLRAAVALAIAVVPLGIAFFSRRPQVGTHISWMGPWVSAVLAVSVSFLLTPLYSFLEGCNQIWQVAKVRMFQAFATVAMSWAAIASGHGLYACALVNLGVVLVGAALLLYRRKLFFDLLRHPTAAGGISWRKEVWPFQWRIALSWLCSYFMMQIFTPILFVCRGAAEAGKLGLSLSIAGYLPVVVLSWITPKATPFGRLVRLGQFQELDAFFSTTLKQSLALMLLLVTACFSAVVAVQRVLPNIAMRMEPPGILVLLLLTAIGTFIVQSLAVCLRSFKQEPYLHQSITVAGLTFLGVLLAAPGWGSSGVAIVYFLCNGVLGTFWAMRIFHQQRQTWMEV